MDRTRFPESLSADPVTAFHEAYRVGQRPSAFDLGMADQNDVDNDDIQALNDALDRDEDDAAAEGAGGGTMLHTCTACGHGNAVAPPLGHRLKRKAVAVAESKPARVFRERYQRIGRASLMVMRELRNGYVGMCVDNYRRVPDGAG
jgi:hypothetical protein